MADYRHASHFCIAVLSPAALIADCVLNDDIPQWATALFGIWEILAATYCVAVAFSFHGYFRPWSPEAIWFLVKVACIDLPGFVAVLAGYDGGLLAFLFQGIVELILFSAGVIESNDMIYDVGDLVSCCVHVLQPTGDARTRAREFGRGHWHGSQQSNLNNNPNNKQKWC